MAEVAPADAVAAPVAAPVKPAKKKGPAKVKRPGSNTADLVLKAVSESKERKGLSYQALKRNLAAQGCDNPALVKRVVKNLVANKKLVQTKGAGASGSFKAAKTAEKPKKVSKKTDKAKKPAAKKPAAKKPAAKKPAAKKPVAAKKLPAAKKPKASKTTPKVKKVAVKKVSATKVSATMATGVKKGSKKNIVKNTAAAAKKPAAKKAAKK